MDPKMMAGMSPVMMQNMSPEQCAKAAAAEIAAKHMTPQMQERLQAQKMAAMKPGR